MSNAKTTTKSEAETPAPVAEDSQAAELAALRQRVETQEAALGRLQEMAATMLRACPCGKQMGNQRAVFFADNVVYCDSGHYSWFSQRGQE
jgi:hypothetical protein